jgi:hypothetical protein
MSGLSGLPGMLANCSGRSTVVVLTKGRRRVAMNASPVSTEATQR